MQTLITNIRIWFGFEPAERKWWDKDPINIIQGPALIAALNHRRACA